MDGQNAAQFERNWAMLAHLTALATLAAGLSAGGGGLALALLIPLALALYFWRRSPYVAYHALQATAFQAAAAVACVALAVILGVGLVVTWALTGALSLLLVGLVLLPAALGLTLLAALALVGAPLGAVGLTLRGAYQAYLGEHFEYPLIGAGVSRLLGVNLR